MTDILLLLIINSFVCYGFYHATVYHTYEQVADIKPAADKGVLWFVSYWVKGTIWEKPVCNCLTCMASLHSVYVYWSFMDWTLDNLYVYPVYILSLAGFNTLLDVFTDYLSKD